jgi:signal transduction histidine kinase
MLQRRDDVPADAARDLEVVLGEIHRIQAKLRNLLDLSRLESGRMRLDPAPFASKSRYCQPAVQRSVLGSV